MKTYVTLIMVLFLTITSFAQPEDNYLFTINDAKIGGYLSLGGRFNKALNSDPAGFGDFRGVLVFKGGWGVGLSASGLYYDKKLSSLVNDGTYHFFAGYGGLYVEKMFDIYDDMKFSVSISSGAGEAYYRYDKEFQAEKKWTEEFIDHTVFYVFEPGIELQHRISGNWWVSLYGTYRNTSPLHLIGTEEDLFRNFSGGISFKWGMF